MAAVRRRVRAWLCSCVLGGLFVGLTPVGAVVAAPPLCFGKVPTIVGTARDDVLVGTAGPDVIVGLEGVDHISGRGGDDRICGGDNEFTGLHADPEDFETLLGETGNDLLAGQDGLDQLEGGVGDDQLFLGPSPLFEDDEESEPSEIGDGGPGDDLLSAGAGFDELWGGDGNDRLFAGSSLTALMGGGAGDDVLVGGSGYAELFGGAGDDLGFAGTGGASWIGAGGADGDVDRFYGGAGSDSSWGVDKGRLIARGAGGNDVLAGGNQNDIIIGGEGDDVLVGYGGDDQLRGGAGRDRINYYSVLTESNEKSPNENRMRVDLQRGRATGLGHDTLSSIEGVAGGAGDDVLLGSQANNAFYIDYFISTENGRDRIDGRGGRDRIEVEPFFDSDFANPAGGMRADLIRGTVELDDGRGRAQVTSIEDLTGGYLGRDLLRGDSGPNTIRGEDLSEDGQFYDGDIINGRGGDDRLFGGAGPDRIFGGPGRDLLRGGARRDRLSGGPGNDRLDGGRGADVNNGGSGRDTCLSPARGPSTRSCE